MSIKFHPERHWVSEHGAHGYSDLITFEDGDLTPRQMDVFNILDDESKYEYLWAILYGQPTQEWEGN